MPACTIVIPTYNHADELAESLDSLLAQTVADWEAIVVDDASTVGDVEAVVRARSDERIRYLRHPTNLGPAAARNTGIRAGSGSFIVPFDSDDRLTPTFLARLSGVLAADPGVDCVFPDFALFGSRTGLDRFEVRDARAMCRTQWPPGAGCMYRRTLWERAGGYCEDPALRAGNEDWDFWLAAAEAGFTASHIPEPLYEYRISPGSLGMRLRSVNDKTREFIFARHRALFERYHEGPVFLAEGYQISARSRYEYGRHRQAIRLALRSLRLDPRNRSTLGVIARSLVPRSLADVARRGLGRSPLPNPERDD
jgi:glycosyltransferase involved in cell wall biosynthesis